MILVIGKEVYEEEELSWCEEKKDCNKCSEVARRGGFLSALIPGKVVKYLGELCTHDRVVILYLY